MAGLEPAIHVFSAQCQRRGFRAEPGDDGGALQVGNPIAPPRVDPRDPRTGRGGSWSSHRPAELEPSMKASLAFAALLALAAAACTTTEQRVGGAAVGAGVGAIAGPVGAVAGGAVGAATGPAVTRTVRRATR